MVAVVVVVLILILGAVVVSSSPRRRSPLAVALATSALPMADIRRPWCSSLRWSRNAAAHVDVAVLVDFPVLPTLLDEGRVQGVVVALERQRTAVETNRGSGWVVRLGEAGSLATSGRRSERRDKRRIAPCSSTLSQSSKNPPPPPSDRRRRADPWASLVPSSLLSPIRAWCRSGSARLLGLSRAGACTLQRRTRRRI